MSHDLWVWLAILGVSSTTVITRCSFLVLGEHAKLPEIVERALRHAPAAALAALIGPDLLIHGGQLDIGPANPRLVGALAGALTFMATRGMVWTIVVGMAAYTLVRLWG